jgi:hypothetical protein
MTDVMDVYCERVGPGLLAEPLNAVSNASFLLAAWAAWVLAKRTGTLSAGVRALIAIAALVGIGSILWHTYATSLALILDIVPILIFIIWFIWLYTRTVWGCAHYSLLRLLRRSCWQPLLPFNILRFSMEPSSIRPV